MSAVLAMPAICPLCPRMCCKTIFTTRMSNIDSRTSTSAQRRFKNTVHLDSIIARSQRSKEFCNTIPPESGHIADIGGCRRVNPQETESRCAARSRRQTPPPRFDEGGLLFVQIKPRTVSMPWR